MLHEIQIMSNDPVKLRALPFSRKELPKNMVYIHKARVWTDVKPSWN